MASLDLAGLDIPSLPDALFSGHEPLWRSLRLNWGALEPRAFRRAFDYVHENPAHLVDESQMVTQYCLQRLRTLNSQDRGMAGNALQAFKQDGLAGRALLDHVEALLERYRVTDEALVTWQESPVRVDGGEMFVEQRRVLADRIRKCRRDALAARYGAREPVAGPSRIGAQTLRTVLDREYSGLGREPLNEVLDLTNYGAPGDLPALGDEVFPQIRHLILSDAKLSATQVDDFLRSFPELRVLNLSGNKLTELPRALETLGQLSELNLAGNELTITASMQARLNRLGEVEALARKRIQRFPGTDPAEIRLAYRTGLAQRLDLPTQPSTMLYRGVSGVQAADLDVAYASVMAEEQTPAFIEQLITRDYWKSYLQEKYPTDFAKVQQTLADQSETLEEQYPDINPAYLEQVDALQKANEVELRGLRRELSTREIAELGN
ncbi:hypothetical protein K7402_27695 [Pseudomonas fluorescens group sp.]|nr:hypothetical protein [Pseudomonas fluorescens group sp.]MBZ6465286.1 hypothetical protein [Pseudomonas fluorescens group sp.]MBZ6471185.1 hypothetical protein [Pseudomonas fluorescens group sp.]